MTKTARKLFLPVAAIVTSVFGAFVPIANVSAADAVVTNYDELVAALSDSSSKIVVDGDITLEDDVTINKVMRMNSATTLDTNGHTMTLNKTMAVWADTTIIGNGGIESDIENPIMAIEGNLTIEDGNYSAGVNTYAFMVTIDGYAGNIYVKGGSFNIKNIIINNYGSGEVIITGGEFVSEGSYAEDEWSDAAFMTSSDGKFEINGEDVTVESYYRFLGNKFVDDDEDRGKVVCAQGEIYEEMDWDDDWNEIDYNTYSVCGVDETQDSDDSADGSVSYKLINSNYTIAAGATLSNSSATIIIGEGSTLTICGEYDGPDGSLITEDGGTIVYSCEEEPKPVPASDNLNPNTFDGIESAFAMLISSISLLIGLVIERRHF